MNTDEIIREIEDKSVVINPNWFYHGSMFDSANYKNMIQEGIKCSKLLHTSYGGTNGKYYISVSKRITTDRSAFTLYQNKYPLFILDNLLSFHAKNQHCIFTNSIFPSRYSSYEDEWQVFLRINPNKIIGIEFALYTFLQQDKNFALETAMSLIVLLKELEMPLPIYDFSTEREINQKKFLKLMSKEKF